MNGNATKSDWETMVDLAREKDIQPATAYEFSNGRRFSHPQRPSPQPPPMMAAGAALRRLVDALHCMSHDKENGHDQTGNP
ncbi:MAG: hypothetical protein HQL76_08810 [Magnetococcales bacterium]|nr:hypothetical protein [Magnetococcales bacterium]